MRKVYMTGERNNPISLISNENSPGNNASVNNAPRVVPRRYQVTNLPGPRAVNRREQNARDNRVGTLITVENVRMGERRAAAALWHRVMAFIEKHPRATEAAAKEADRLGLSVVLQRVKKGTRQYEWQVLMYGGR